MTTIQRTFGVAAPPAVVLEYLEDFGRTEQWDPGTVSTTRTDGDGPVAVGATWRNVSKIAGIQAELDYTLTERTDERVVFVGENIKGSASTADTIAARPAGTGSEIEYIAEIDLHGLARIGTPVLKAFFEKVGEEVVENLTSVFGAPDGSDGDPAAPAT